VRRQFGDELPNDRVGLFERRKDDVFARLSDRLRRPWLSDVLFGLHPHVSGGWLGAPPPEEERGDRKHRHGDHDDRDSPTGSRGLR
jgi:hypothetical protein